MSFVLDTDTCSAYLKGDRRVSGRFLQYTGGLYVSAMTVAELYAGACRAGQPSNRLAGIADLHKEVTVISIDATVAEIFGRVRAALNDKGIVVADADLLIASTALSVGYTVVTHNTRHFSLVPGLRLEDWLSP